MKKYECEECGHYWSESAIRDDDESEDPNCPECGRDLVYYHGETNE
ncbi:hypothetical protein KAR91_02435 [Candidatus Pacearchaeota archaeon]|nr:hypothetical protein [Candidatus Pacearchaeota archaeon]